MRVAIIILVHDQLPYTKLCYESILQHTTIPYKIIFVSNGCTLRTYTWLLSTGATVLYSPTNLSFSEGNNFGLTALDPDCEFVIFLNNDTVVTPGWLIHLLAPFDDCDVGLVGPVTNVATGAQFTTVDYDVATLEGLDRFCVDHRLSLYSQGYPKTTPCIRLVGFCLMARKSMLDTIGHFDTIYERGAWEDDDLCFRSVIWGYKNLLAYTCYIHHFGSVTFHAIGWEKSLEGGVENGIRFHQKWGPVLPEHFEWSPYPDVSGLRFSPEQARLCDINYYLDKGDSDRATILERRHQELKTRNPH
jgi:GT2 family glycosyltransferase